MAGWKTKQMQKNTADFVRGFNKEKTPPAPIDKAIANPQEDAEFEERKAEAAKEAGFRAAKAKKANDELRRNRGKRTPRPLASPEPSSLEMGHTKSSFEDLD